MPSIKAVLKSASERKMFADLPPSSELGLLDNRRPADVFRQIVMMVLEL